MTRSDEMSKKDTKYLYPHGFPVSEQIAENIDSCLEIIKNNKRGRS
jgi:hypothetical protein